MRFKQKISKYCYVSISFYFLLRSHSDIGSSSGSPPASTTKVRGGNFPASHKRKAATTTTTSTDRTLLTSRNFIHYSQDGFLTENGSLAFPINIEETMAVLTRCSFDESHRQPISLLGGIPALAELIQVKTNKKKTTCSPVWSKYPSFLWLVRKRFIMQGKKNPLGSINIFFLALKSKLHNGGIRSCKDN